MKDHFPFYYRLSDDDKKALFKDDNCIFFFDTNAMLDIYRLGEDIAKKILNIVRKYKKKIRIPYHVAEEYHEEMLNVITSIYSDYNNFIRDNDPNEIANIFINALKIDKSPYVKRFFNVTVAPAINSFYKKVKSEKDYIYSQFCNWNLQKEISDLFGEMLLKPFSEEEIKKIEEDGDKRYSQKVPPGYMDSKKDDNKYGDLIIWKEILRYCSEEKKSAILISRDLKEDWILKLNGVQCGPRQELLEEFYNSYPEGQFHIYTLDQFIKFADEDKSLTKQEIESIIDVSKLIGEAEKKGRGITYGFKLPFESLILEDPDGLVKGGDYLSNNKDSIIDESDIKGDNINPKQKNIP